MLCAFHLIDRPGSAALRLQMRPEHKACLARLQDRIALAGPLLQDDGQTLIGSLLVIDFPGRAAAGAWLAQEPFHRSGLYGSVQIQAFSNLWPQRIGLAP